MRRPDGQAARWPGGRAASRPDDELANADIHFRTPADRHAGDAHWSLAAGERNASSSGRLAARPPGRLILSDVDGTFLTDDGRIPFDPAFLRHVYANYRVVFASSRTVEELRKLEEALGWTGPLIAEDGHVIGHEDGSIELLGLRHNELIDRLRESAGWDALEAIIARHPVSTRWRRASVLVPRAVAEDPSYERLRQAIADAELSLSVGGDWCILGSGGSKVAAAYRLIELEELAPDHVVAIGNEANDEALLREFPTAFVIRNAGGHHPSLAAIAGAARCHAEGPLGWLEMIDALDRASQGADQ